MSLTALISGRHALALPGEWVAHQGLIVTHGATRSQQKLWLSVGCGRVTGTPCKFESLLERLLPRGRESTARLEHSQEEGNNMLANPEADM
jgi:hypothetical protein